MKKILIAMLAMATVLFATSCGDDETGNASLSLSETSIKFTEKAGEKTVEVTTDAENWSAIGSAEWIMVEKADGKLIVKVAENKNVYARSGQVLVVAGNANATIAISQAKLMGSAKVTPESLKLSNFGGAVEVEVVANAADWKATTDVDWLKVEAKPRKDMLIVKFDPNEGDDERTATIILTIGEDDQEIAVTQLGSMLYYIPYVDFKGYTLEALKQYEAGYANTLVAVKADEIDYKTRSKVTPEQKYFLDMKDNTILESAVTYAKDAATMQEHLEPFGKFLEENGFAKTDSENVYYSKDKYVKASIIILAQYNVAGIVYKYEKVEDQPSDMPTFTKFPWISELPWASTDQQVKDFEAANNGTLNDEYSTIDPNAQYDILGYDVDTKGNEETPKIRFYIVGHDASGKIKDGLVFKEQVFGKTELAFYKDGDNYRFTKEFLELAKKEEFELKGGPDADGWYDFDNTNADKNLFMKIRVVQFEGDDAPSLDMLMQRLDAVSQAAGYVPTYFSAKINTEEVVKFPTVK